MSAPTVDRVEAALGELRAALDREAQAWRAVRLRRAAVARLLRTARHERGLSLRQAAAMGIVSHVAVSKLERGDAWSRDLAERLAAAYAERCR